MELEASVADRFEAGTDSPIFLKLKNRGTGEECETEMLDVSCTFNHAPCTIRLPVDNHDNWYRGVTETFYRSKFAPCRFFSPSQNGGLMFNIKNTGSDDLLLESVKVYFEVLGSLFDGSKVKAEDYPTLSFTWNGLHWFNNGNQDKWHSFE